MLLVVGALSFIGGSHSLQSPAPVRSRCCIFRPPRASSVCSFWSFFQPMRLTEEKPLLLRCREVLPLLWWSRRPPLH
ncbi:hypothetical protein BHE74_00047852 [Ensete ventricosum]|nr:hypothetical protein BHE74_00047852 [Ensete ventricosum]RZS24058.1 hypothetical protein BHM03_00057087 [Ensete ventricosum]